LNLAKELTLHGIMPFKVKCDYALIIFPVKESVQDVKAKSWYHLTVEGYDVGWEDDMHNR